VSIPIIFIHKNNSEHLKYSFTQAQKNDNQVIVLGDESNSVYPWIKHYPIHEYKHSSDKFEPLYEHLSTNGYFVELMCFQRWFILKDFMEGNNIATCLHLDSDVMLYSNAEKEYYKKFNLFEFTLSHRTCGSNSFITLKGIQNFCDFLVNVYGDKQSYYYDKIKSHYQVRQKHGLPGGVCDMTLLELYGYLNCGKIGEMMHIWNDWSTYDHNINESDQGYSMKNGIKDIIIENGIPYGILPGVGKIQFNTLHFQGPAKVKMVDYVL